LLSELAQSDKPIVRKLSAADIDTQTRPEKMTEAEFRWQLNEDAMATEKTAEGIRAFAVDQVKLEQVLGNLL
jgi:transaldolase